jgi:hypothetical protein
MALTQSERLPAALEALKTRCYTNSGFLMMFLRVVIVVVSKFLIVSGVNSFTRLSS